MITTEKSSDPLNLKLQDLLRSGQFVALVDLLEPVCHSGQANAVQQYYYAVGLAETGKMKQAVSAFETATEQAPHNIVIQTNLGRAYISTGNYQGALEPLQRALELNPSHRPAQKLLLQAYISLHETNKAGVLCDTLLSSSEHEAEVKMQIGIVRKLQGRFDDAMRIYDDLLHVSPQAVPVLINKGLLLQSMNNLPEAIDIYEKVVSISPEMAAAWRILAHARLSNTDLEGAIYCFNKAFSLQSDDIETGIHLAKALRRAGRLTESENVCRKILEVDPENPEARFFQDAFSKQGQKQKLDRIPADVSRQIFSGKGAKGSLASGFDKSLKNSLDYKAPSVLNDAVRTFLANNKRLIVLELGCGSGLCGSMFSDIAARLIGTDISPDMLEGAKEKGTYTELYEADLIDALDNYDDEVDLVIAMDVLCFFGDLAGIFQRCRKALRVGGMFGFSVVKPKSDANWELQQYGHFVHSIEFIREVADATDFSEMYVEELPLRRELNEDHYGYVCVFRKK